MNLACRMMKDGTCTIPCYAEEEDCNLTVVKIFLAKHYQAKDELPILYKINRIMWHGEKASNGIQEEEMSFVS